MSQLSKSLVLETGFDHLNRDHNETNDDSAQRLSQSLDSIPSSSQISASQPVTPMEVAHKRPFRSRSQPTTRRNSTVSINNALKNVTKWVITSKKLNPEEEDYNIEYSVLQPVSRIKPIKDEKEFGLMYKKVVEDHGGVVETHYSLGDFNRLMNSIMETIEINKIQPTRISKGSSGSYFVYNQRSIEFGMKETYKVGVFKPKDEEPYGPLSPKWRKWIHRTFFPWFFGRACLLKNQGFISEVAASYLDQRLLSFIVPYTDVIYLKSPNFYYSYWDRKILYKSDFIKWKLGSFQVFLNDYIETEEFFKIYPLPNNFNSLPDNLKLKKTDKLIFHWNKASLIEFQHQLEKLVILDYLIRNTDRGLDNWMIKIDWKETESLMVPVIKIGAIDSGLAFPWKHPDDWRSFPYGWLFLPYSIIGQPFSTKTRNHYLKLLTSKSWWETTTLGLKNIFKKTKSFKEKNWRRQLAIIKGQAYNIVEVLKISNSTPLDLSKKQRMLIWDELMNVPFKIDDRILNNALHSNIHDVNISTINKDNEETPLLASNNQTKKVVIERLEKVDGKSPFFSCC